MKIELVRGCIADRFDIDDKPAYAMSVEELKTAFSKVCEYILQLPQEQPYNLRDALYNLVETFAPFECSEDACECCGDFIETYTLEL
jgi:hypothetical protein